MNYVKRVAFVIATAGIVSSCASVDTQFPRVEKQPNQAFASPSVPMEIAKEIVRKFKKVSSLRNSAMSYGDDPLLVGGDVFWQKALADDSTPKDTLQNLSLAEVMYGKYILEAANRSERKVGKITPQPLVIDSPYPSKRKLYKNRKHEKRQELARNGYKHLKKWTLSKEQKIDPLQSSSEFNPPAQDERLARIEKMLAEQSKESFKPAATSSIAQDERLARIEKMLAEKGKDKERTIEVKDSIFAKAFVEGTNAYTSKGSDKDGAYLRYHVKKGDSLWLISKRVFKDAELWPYIFDSNRTKISNPHWIYPGQTFDFRSDTNDIATQNKYRKQARRWARTRNILSVPLYQENNGTNSFVNSNFYSDL